MPTVTSAELTAGTFSDGCHLWRAKPGVRSTFAEHVAARALFLDLHADQFWNPWRMEDQAAELERAMTVIGEWQRAEPGFRRKTNRQIEAMTLRWDRESERDRARREKDRQASAPQPLAVVPSGLPTPEVMEQLAAINSQYPDAQVRRGRANRWEVWPAPDTSGRAPAE